MWLAVCLFEMDVVETDATAIKAFMSGTNIATRKLIVRRLYYRVVFGIIPDETK